MSADADLAELAAACGIFDQFRDLEGVMRPTSPDTQRALLRAGGFAAQSAAEVAESLARLRAEQAARLIPEEIIVTSGQAVSVPCAAAVDWQLVLEGADSVHLSGGATETVTLPSLPMGLHKLCARGSGRSSVCRVIAAPPRAPLLPEVTNQQKSWGVVAALYGLRSQRNQGLGDFEDLAQLAETLGPLGAGFLGLNPVHALGWAAAEVISPYSPSHRGCLNPAHLAIGRLPGAASGATATPAGGELIDYAAHGPQHRQALRGAYATFEQTATAADRAAFAEFVHAGGRLLEDFARFECLSTQHGTNRRLWPEALRHPELQRATALPEEAGFHLWMQWQADIQLGDAHRRAMDSGMGLGLYLDLAVGARRDGAEAWCAGEALARDVSLGAPPDHLSPAGQNWQLAAYAPRGLAGQDYAPFRTILRQSMRHCGLFRIDHALGLNRSYWIPDDGSPGGYIRQPFEALMALIAIEAHRAQTVIVGEDLGLVPDGFRETMADKGLYGYTVMQYEKTEAGRFRRTQDLRPQSLACFGTHDTPTIAGFCAGRDIDWWHRLGWIDEAARKRAQRRRKSERADLLGQPGTPAATDTPCDQIHRQLAGASAALAAVQLDDVLGVIEAQNLPGTVEEHPNWRRRSPVAIEALSGHEGLTKTARLMAEAGRGTFEDPI
ncbi:4-alpha-glucanotransferase [Roseobacter cerasinus]|uniref:4-alpha-glucanotransferase n=1 Tax=Roseobacter cerasinus TaxID=2602289 RepID=A0A640VQU2_9RHOB|nr:4-alpha-glucanotransferase [Roseobacter cerasinus]GFE49810.1 4-alpha-glucanotransferase [Roseobacter cerasinus]